MMIDLIRGSRCTRFSWAKSGNSSVSVIEFEQTNGGRCVSSEVLPRPEARCRWSQMIRAGWKRLNKEPLGTSDLYPTRYEQDPTENV
jgi:hypothetical protein